MSANRRRWRSKRWIAPAVVTAALTVALAAPAAASAVSGTRSASVVPSRGAGHDGAATLHLLASGAASTSQPDDLTMLGGHLFVAFQNGIGPKGQPSTAGNVDSTVVEYPLGGHRVRSWHLTGHVDGLSADAAHQRLIATVNEDGNSSLYTIAPDRAGGQVRHYRYNLNPLPHGGGTDAISLYHGRILISASAPTKSAGPAAYQARLADGTAYLRPVFADNATAVVANTDSPKYGTATKLGLTDPDSNEVVPGAAHRFVGDYVLDSQGDGEQIYVHDAGGPRQRRYVLKLSTQVDDSAWATARHGTLYAAATGQNKVFALRGVFTPGTAFVAVTPNKGTGYLGTLNMRTGVVTPYVTDIAPSGLLFVPGSGHR